MTRPLLLPGIKKEIFILIGLLVILFSCENKTLCKTGFEKFFGGENFDYGKSVVEADDSGYVTAGTTYSFGAGKADVYLVKTDNCGALLWYKTFGGKEDDSGASLLKTKIGDYIIAGTTGSYNPGDSDIYVVKTDRSGNLQWAKNFGSKSMETGYSICETGDGGFIIAGGTKNNWKKSGGDVYLVKIDNQGSLEWDKNIGSDRFDEAVSICRDNDGNFIITGYTLSGKNENFSDVLLIKIDPDGIILWIKTFGGNDEDIGMSVSFADDGGYFIAGYSSSFNPGSHDIYLIKTGKDGEEQWSQVYGNSSWQQAFSGLQTDDGGFIITGRSGDSVFLLKTGIDGNKQWMKLFGYDSTYIGYSVFQTRDKHYLVTGGPFIGPAGDLLFLKTNFQGNLK